MTPEATARAIVQALPLSASSKVLEPGFGEGAFLLALIERLLALRDGDLGAVLNENVWGVEIDPRLYSAALSAIANRFGPLPDKHNLVLGDFLLTPYPEQECGSPHTFELLESAPQFDLVVGNPPFGATISLKDQDVLERRYGTRHGLKIKRESYAYFIVKSSAHLKIGGTLKFICSDTFLTIPTMKGLRRHLMKEGRCDVVRLSDFSDETNYPMVVLTLVKGEPSRVTVDHEEVPDSAIRSTGNLSWQANSAFAGLFQGPSLGDFVVASSGMTTGKNEYFVRDIADGAVLEPFQFEYFDDPITVAGEISRARLGKLSARAIESLRLQEASGKTRRNVRVITRSEPKPVRLPHPDYRFYNKAQPGILYAPPRYAIYWKDEGDAVITFKKNGNWYLHGVGGAPYFGREGVTWRLIASQIDARYLPEGYILDSGAPCAFLREGVDGDELWFILGWLLSDLATRVLKEVLNHTMNIQSKDIERLPYPWWVSEADKSAATRTCKALVDAARKGTILTRESPELLKLAEYYSAPGARDDIPSASELRLVAT